MAKEDALVNLADMLLCVKEDPRIPEIVETVKDVAEDALKSFKPGDKMDTANRQAKQESEVMQDIRKAYNEGMNKVRNGD